MMIAAGVVWIENSGDGNATGADEPDESSGEDRQNEQEDAGDGDDGEGIAGAELGRGEEVQESGLRGVAGIGAGELRSCLIEQCGERCVEVAHGVEFEAGDEAGDGESDGEGDVEREASDDSDAGSGGGVHPGEGAAALIEREGDEGAAEDPERAEGGEEWHAGGDEREHGGNDSYERGAAYGGVPLDLPGAGWGQGSGRRGVGGGGVGGSAYELGEEELGRTAVLAEGRGAGGKLAAAAVTEILHT
jgi:hypothetical protein